MTCRAPVNKIVPLSAVDGPGARAAIFLQGCNLSCLYCHNPETQRQCVHCGACTAVCHSGALASGGGSVKWGPGLCSGCDECIRAGPNFSSPKTTLMTPAEVMETVRPELPFIRGITVSGGECTLYPEFLTQLFKLARNEGLGCLIDSNGTLDFAGHPNLLSACDGVLFDVKAWDKNIYSHLTGAADNGVIKSNLALLAKKGLLRELRIVCLDGYVDSAAVIEGAAELLGELAAGAQLKLINFRGAGVRTVLRRLRDLALSCGFIEVVTV